MDTLLGLSTDLWPIIHRLSHLLSFKRSLEVAISAGETSKATVLKTELESTAQAIEIALQNWKPSTISKETLSGEPKKEFLTEEVISAIPPDSRMQSILNNAEAYRHSAFVYLYRTVRSFPRTHSSVQKHTHLSLVACASVVKNAEECLDGPMSALLWPLFVAACEATSLEDRALAMNAFSGTERRQKMTNIKRAWEVVEEVWKRADQGELTVDWTAICAERGFNIIFG